MDGEKVGHGDRQHDDDEEHVLPVLDHGTEDLHQHGAEREGCGSLRDNRQIAGNGGGSALVRVGCPEVEGHERNLEAQTADKEHKTHDDHRSGRESHHYVVEVECAYSAIEQADTIEHHAAREGGGEDELGTCLG